MACAEDGGGQGAMRLGASSLAFFRRQSEEIIRIVGEAGFSALEIILEGHHLREDYSPWRELLDSYSMEVSVHAPFADLNIASMNPRIRLESIAQVKDAIQAGYTLGADVVTVHSGRLSPHSMWFPERAAELNLQAIEELVEFAGEHGVLLCVENMPRHEGALMSEVEELLELAERFSRREMGITLDVGHAATCGDVVEYVEALGERIANVHLHDNRGDGDEHLAVGDGKIDFGAVLSRMRGYRGRFIIECHREEDVFLSGRRLRRML
ncbi:MAG: sugar phosphate isomerase/epimerase [Euryarchaeota archaeon]|nr:sugar phosphate isomerase/epimerase [Euryarchaeota archaeon]